MHELYCAGHLIEAAVAYYEATGKRHFLDVMCRYADHIASIFGPKEGQKRGYPGHEEIELALVKLYRVTGQEKYLSLAQFFIDERGRRPHYFDLEAQARGEKPGAYRWADHTYTQSHVPVREQRTAEGHAVRAMYLFCGMTDVAAETGDETLLEACRRLWDNVTRRRMYVTGGIGSSAYGERFTCDYDLSPDLAYAETCAAIGLVFWAHRMLQLERDARYADVMERALYNGVLSGISLDGKRFFYGNPLEVEPARHRCRPDLFHPPAVVPVRQEWFGCACCPPNIARLLASLGQYIYSVGEEGIYVHLYIGGHAKLNVNQGHTVIEQETRYPWEGRVRLRVLPKEPSAFTIALRIPSWAAEDGGAILLRVNGEPLDARALLDRGYAKISRLWRREDEILLEFPMTIQRLEAHPRVRACHGRIALQRGPLVYCLEEADNRPNLDDIALPVDAALEAEFDPTLLGGIVTIRGEGLRSGEEGWDTTLYRPTLRQHRPVPVTAIPYYAWANRASGEMLVWIREIG